MMGPSCRRRTRNSTARRRTHIKKEIQSSNNEEKSAVSPVNSLVKPDSLQIEGSEDLKISCKESCSTPKAERFRIPEIQTCPPAPKKRRIIAGCSLEKRTPIAFFKPPDIELFFYLALRGVSV